MPRFDQRQQFNPGPVPGGSGGPGDGAGKDLLPRGVYRCSVLSRQGVRDKYDRDQLVVRFQIEEGEYRGTTFTEPFTPAVADQLGLSDAGAGLWDVWVAVHVGDNGRVFNSVSQVAAVEPVVETQASAQLDGIIGSGSEWSEQRTLGHARADDNVLDAFSTGFWIQGQINSPRNVGDWLLWFNHTCFGVSSAPPGQELYLSTYAFTQNFRAYVDSKNGSTAGYHGPAYAPLIWFDVDREAEDSDGKLNPDLDSALVDTQNLVACLMNLGVPEEYLFIFFSGQKGFHVGVPTSLFAAVPSDSFVDITGIVCRALARRANCKIDPAIYTPLQPLRAPNSWHRKGGLYKVRMSVAELHGYSAEQVRYLAAQPRLFEPIDLRTEPIARLADAWVAAGVVDHEKRRVKVNEMSADSDARLFRSTMDFITVGSPDGQRASDGFKAGMNLLDFGTIDELVAALLAHGFSRSGYPPSEAQQQIAGVLKHWRENQASPSAGMP